MMKTLKILAVLALFGIVAGTCVTALAVWYFGRDLPDYEALAHYKPPVVTRVYAGDGRLLAQYAAEDRVFVPVSAMPPLVIHAFLAAEDRYFYSHPGINPFAVARAAAIDIVRLAEHRRPIGASTITQQVAKNFFLTNRVSMERKIKEALLAIRLEQTLTKERILELYLNEIYLGDGSYGVAAAALNYFNKPLGELTVAEAAFLAALPKAPDNYDPRRHPEAAKERRDWVIDRMADAGFVTAPQAQMAKAEPITLRRRDPTEIVKAPYFADEVRTELLQRYGRKEVYEGGLVVHTSLDPALQADATRALRGALEAYDRRHGWRGPVTHIALEGDWQSRLAVIPLPAGAADVHWKLAVVLATRPDAAVIGFPDGQRAEIPYGELRWARKYVSEDAVGPVPGGAGSVVSAGDVVLVERLEGSGKVYGLRQIPAVSGALVALDPHTGRVLAMSGGFSFAMSQFDRATQAKRQTGSAIKPFIYLAALDHGFTPSTMVLDAPFVVDQGPGLPKWNPTNYEHKFYGPVPLFFGLQESLNLVTARVGTTVGLPIIRQYLVDRFHILDQMPLEDSYILGAGATTPLRLTTAYAMLVNGGKRIHPTFIDRVQDRNGVTIYRADERPCEGCSNVAWAGQAPPDLPDTRAQIADPRSCYQVVSMLEGVVRRGTGRIVASVGKPLAGKTGTTNESNDTWFVGFSPDLVAGVYVGFDQPKSLGKHEVGATVAAPAFRDFMAAALKNKPAIPFRIPPGIELVRIDGHSGRLPAAGDRAVIWGAFKPGTEPTGEPGQVVSGRGITPDAGDAVPNGAAAGNEADTGAQAAPRTGTGGLY